jgi:hypothetical protein
MAKHSNNGNCQRCLEIIDRYPDFNKDLKQWFKTLQKEHPEAHISCAGRGKQDQEEAVIRKASKAHFGQSAHNYNAALDFFELAGKSSKDIYEREWFESVLAPEIPDWIEWYGKPGAKFPELPHVELKGWRQLASKGILKLVE